MDDASESNDITTLITRETIDPSMVAPEIPNAVHLGEQMMSTDLSNHKNIVRAKQDLMMMLVWAAVILIIIIMLFFNQECSDFVDTCIDTFVETIDPESEE